MAKIDTEADARRLARAIASDLVLYNDEKISTGADMSEEVAEGRALFVERTSKAFHGLYDEALASVGRGRIRYRAEEGSRNRAARAGMDGPSNEVEPSATDGPTDEAESDSAAAATSIDSDPWGHDETGRAKGAGAAAGPMLSSQSADRFKSFFSEDAGMDEPSVAPHARPKGPPAELPRMLVFVLTAIVVGVLVYYLRR